jgi:hypothetical protein
VYGARSHLQDEEQVEVKHLGVAVHDGGTELVVSELPATNQQP